MSDISVYTISPTVSFVDALAAGILEEYSDNPLDISKIRILLPNRRSCRNLKEAFIRQNSSAPMLLPLIRGIGDTDEFELMISPGSSYEEIPPAISVTKRKLLLSSLIQKWNSNLNIEQAIALASDLSCFLDEVQKEKLSFDSLTNIVPEELASHWQITLDFFDILSKEWPKILEQYGLIDPVERRNRLIEVQANIWRENPPAYPIIAAGSTGSNSSTSLLLKTISSLPSGKLILPGLDKKMDLVTWESLDESHPQFALKALLKQIGVKREQVAAYNPEFSNSEDKEIESREFLLSEVMRPSVTVKAWRNNNISQDSIKNISQIEAEHIGQEATIIALMLRETLEKEEKTAAFVTHSRELARRVAAIMKKWRIDIDDSAGKEFLETPQVIFLGLIAKTISENFSAISLLALLKHPFSNCGKEEDEYKELLIKFEKNLLRGIRIGNGFESFYNALNATKLEQEDKEQLLSFLETLESIFSDLTTLMFSGQSDLSFMLQTHIKCAEKLASTDKQTGESILWNDDCGEKTAALISEFIISSEGQQITSPGNFYPGLLKNLWSGQVYRPKSTSSSRLSILSPMEARLRHYDLMILGGLNQGSWPMESSSPWMSKSMKSDFGLPPDNRKTGLSAHDFFSACLAKEVVLTRSVKVAGSPTVPSSWLLRLEAVLDSSNIDKKLIKPKEPWHEWADIINNPEKKVSIKAPAPTPNASARPSELSVTAIERLMRDPYSIYASHILKLKPLDEIDKEPGIAEFGSYVHKAIDIYIKELEQDEDQLAKLLECGRRVFSIIEERPATYKIWWSRFKIIANWFVEQQIEQEDVKIISEVGGAINFSAEGKKFSLFAKADRIEVNSDGKINIIDYKTGVLPQKIDIAYGISSQLSLEGLIAASGGFNNTKFEINDLSYWKLSGAYGSSKISSFSNDYKLNLEETIKDAETGIKKIMASFSNENTPYLSVPDLRIAPKYNDYEHLARIKEWLFSDNDDDEKELSKLEYA